MRQYFDVDFAKETSIEEACILQFFFNERIKAGPGISYTTVTLEELFEMFPYFSHSKIREALKSLEEDCFLTSVTESDKSRVKSYSITKAGAAEIMPEQRR